MDVSTRNSFAANFQERQLRWFLGQNQNLNKKWRKHSRRFNIQSRKYCLDPHGEIFPPDRDPIKENSRTFRRALFNHDRWAAHRSTARYLRHLQGIFRSRIVFGLLKPVGVVTVIAALYSSYMTLMDADQLPDWLSYTINLKGDPFSLTSFALSLLLVFRTDASYGRWEEAQRCWEQIITQSRAILRDSCSVLRSGVGAEERVGDWVCAFSHCVTAELREEVDLVYQLEDRLNQEEIEFIMTTKDKPAAVLQILSKIISTEILVEDNLDILQQHLTILEENTEKARRIFRSPIPLSYTRHTSRFLMVYLAFLPISIWQQCGWFTVPATSITAFLLLGIEEIGVQVEEPFGILPLEHYCNQIEQGVSELLCQRAKISEIVVEGRQRSSSSNHSNSNHVSTAQEVDIK